MRKLLFILLIIPCLCFAQSVNSVSGVSTTSITSINNVVTTSIGTINTISYAAPVDLKTGLLSVWEMNETSGTSLARANGTGYSFTTSGATVNQTGLLDKAVSYDGSNDYAYQTDGTYHSPGANFSMSIWTKRLGNSSVDVGGGLLTKYHSTTGLRIYYSVLMDSDDASQPNYFKFAYYDNANAATETIYNPGSNIWTNNWKHIVVTRSGSSITIYVNGSSAATNSGGNGTGQSSTSTTVTLTMGAWAKSVTTPDIFYYGLIDQVAVWSIALSQDQVTALYNSGSGIPYSSW